MRIKIDTKKIKVELKSVELILEGGSPAYYNSYVQKAIDSEDRELTDSELEIINNDKDILTEIIDNICYFKKNNLIEF